MATNTALVATGLTCAFWTDTSGIPRIRVYYQDSNGYICEVKWDQGVWTSGSQRRFQAPLRTPLAAVTYPGDNEETCGPDPEIRVYYINSNNYPVTLEEYKKYANSDTWGKGDTVPTYNLSPRSALGACEYSDPHVRVYYQDTEGYIRESTWESYQGWTASAGGYNLRISDDPAYIGTPIGATVECNNNYYPIVTVVWQDSDNNVAGATVNQDQPSPLEFGVQYAASPSGTITVAAWYNDKTLIYYDGTDDGVQKLEYTNGSWSGPINAFTGDITQANATGQGSLASAAYAPAHAGCVGSVFYQPVGETNIVEVLI